MSLFSRVTLTCRMRFFIRAFKLNKALNHGKLQV